LLYTVPPCRVIDTREPDGPLGGPILSGNDAVRSFDLGSNTCGIPADAAALVANVTVTMGSARGSLRVYPGTGMAAPMASVLDWSSGQTRASNATLALPPWPGGLLAVQNNSTGPVHLIVDVTGYFK
jgi:hypothetical protein